MEHNLSRHKRTFRKRLEYLELRQQRWTNDTGKESKFFREEINALKWVIETIEQQQKLNHAARRAELGLPYEPSHD